MFKDMFTNPGKYRKFYVALATAVVSLLTIYFGTALWLPVVVNFIGALGVLQVSNDKTIQY